MEKIKSFTLDHNSHKIGFYLSSVQGDIYTYDIRFKKPNSGDYLSTASAHTIEHLFATVIRNSNQKDNVIYFGPMGCRTGFYLLLRNIAYEEARALTMKCFKECLAQTTIPGSEKQECGNYLDHSLNGAKLEIIGYLAEVSESK